VGQSSQASECSTHDQTESQFDRDFKLQYYQHRHQKHLSAEQKRRGAIKGAFEELMRIIPGYGNDSSKVAKLSNAAVLQRAADFVQFLKRERSTAETKLLNLQEQIEKTTQTISSYQQLLPTSGAAATSKESEIVKQGFFAYCKDMIRKDQRFWVFSILLRPLFDSYNNFVSTSTVDEFLNSVSRWLDQYCTLPLLRPAVLNALTQLSTRTALLTDVKYLDIQAAESLKKDDPTEL